MRVTCKEKYEFIYLVRFNLVFLCAKYINSNLNYLLKIEEITSFLRIKQSTIQKNYKALQDSYIPNIGRPRWFIYYHPLEVFLKLCNFKIIFSFLYFEIIMMTRIYCTWSSSHMKFFLFILPSKMKLNICNVLLFFFWVNVSVLFIWCKKDVIIVTIEESIVHNILAIVWNLEICINDE